MGRAGTASAAADQTDANHIAAGGIRPWERITGQQAAMTAAVVDVFMKSRREERQGRIGHGEDLRGSSGGRQNDTVGEAQNLNDEGRNLSKSAI